MKITFFSILFTCLLPLSIMAQKEKADVVITTDSGKIYIQLFDETPIHKANFIKLAKEGFYDGIAFHRIIKNFMIQTGNPSTRTPNPSKEDGPGYMLDAEIVPNFVHTAGMLAAARMGDQVNPEWKSSGSQFYIVTGKTFTDVELNGAANQINATVQRRQAAKMQSAFLGMPENAAKVEQFKTLMANKDSVGARALKAEIDASFTQYINQNSKPFFYTEAQINDYKTKGGSPWLDQQYTIFGQVVEGMEVVYKLGAVKTAPGDKPIDDVRMIKVEVIEKK